jgi:hypothetical protein
MIPSPQRPGTAKLEAAAPAGVWEKRLQPSRQPREPRPGISQRCTTILCLKKTFISFQISLRK